MLTRTLDQTGDGSQVLRDGITDHNQVVGRRARSGVREIIDPASLKGPTAPSPNGDLFARQTIDDMLRDTVCRKLSPGFFLDGIGVPCVVLPCAQQCDICPVHNTTSELS